jgi:hypothetical protein
MPIPVGPPTIPIPVGPSTIPIPVGPSTISGTIDVAKPSVPAVPVPPVSNAASKLPGPTATPQMVGEWLASIGPLYRPYQKAAIDNGVNGEILKQIRLESKEGANVLLQSIGITNIIHQRRILAELQQK